VGVKEGIGSLERVHPGDHAGQVEALALPARRPGLDHVRPPAEAVLVADRDLESGGEDRGRRSRPAVRPSPARSASSRARRAPCKPRRSESRARRVSARCQSRPPRRATLPPPPPARAPGAARDLSVRRHGGGNGGGVRRHPVRRPGQRADGGICRLPCARIRRHRRLGAGALSRKSRIFNLFRDPFTCSAWPLESSAPL